MKRIPCPHTIGKFNKVNYCEDGNINGIRCPFWQQDGQYVYTESALSTSMYIDPIVIKYLDKVVENFEVIGNYQWYCTQWPGIRSKIRETIVQDKTGKKYTVEDIDRIFKEVEIINEEPTDNYQ